MGSSDLPPEIESRNIVADPAEQFCQEHIEMLSDWEIPMLNAIVTMMEAATYTRGFYAVAYRKRNGQEMPDSLGVEETPKTQQPRIEDINAALEEVKPLCCFLVEETENPWPEQPAPPLIAILSHRAAEAEELEEDEREQCR